MDLKVQSQLICSRSLAMRIGSLTDIDAWSIVNSSRRFQRANKLGQFRVAKC